MEVLLPPSLPVPCMAPRFCASFCAMLCSATSSRVMPCEPSRPLMTLALHLLAHTGQPLSLQALTKGLAMPSVAQTGRLVEYLQDAWLLLAVPRFSTKFKQRIISPPKYYAVDPGLAAANSPNPTPDLGCWLENVVMLHLRRLGEAPTFAAKPNHGNATSSRRPTPSSAAPASRLKTAPARRAAPLL